MSFGSISNNQLLAADAQSLGALKLEAGKSSPAAIKETAKQFESLFMRELVKSMREATMKSGMLDSPGGDLGTDLLDQQLSVQMAGQPGGLSDIIALQLTRQMAGAPKDASAPASTQDPAPASAAKVGKPATTTLHSTFSKTSRAPTEAQANFVQKH